jgi:hypothetical protein
MIFLRRLWKILSLIISSGSWTYVSTFFGQKPSNAAATQGRNVVNDAVGTISIALEFYNGNDICKKESSAIADDPGAMRAAPCATSMNWPQLGT